MNVVSIMVAVIITVVIQLVALSVVAKKVINCLLTKEAAKVSALSIGDPLFVSQ